MDDILKNELFAQLNSLQKLMTFLSFAFPRRYLVLLMVTLGYVINIGFRSVYAMVMTHITNVGLDEYDSNIFPNCTTQVGNASFHVSYSSDIVSYTHTVYFLGATTLTVPCGIIATRLSVTKVMGVGMIVCSVMECILPLIIPTHIVLLMFFRFLEGGLEMGVVCAFYAVLTNWAPETEKNRFMTIAAFGVYTGPAFAMFLSGLTSCYTSWYISLLVIGILGIVWSLVLMYCVYDSPAQHPCLSLKETLMFQNQGVIVKSSSKNVMKAVPWRKLMTSLPIHALIVAEFTKDWMFGIMGTEIQEYFKDVFGLNSATLGTLSAIPDLVMAVVAVIGGFVFDYLLIWKILSTTAVRKLAQSLGFGIEACCVIGIYFLKSDNWIYAFILLCVGVGISGLAVSGYEANYMDLDPQYAGIISAISRIGLIGPVVSTALVGAVVKKYDAVKGWNIVFLVSGITHLAGTLFYAIFASGKRLRWENDRKDELVVLPYSRPKYKSIPEE